MSSAKSKMGRNPFINPQPSPTPKREEPKVETQVELSTWVKWAVIDLPASARLLALKALLLLTF